MEDERVHLTIEEIAHVEKATDICHKIGIASAICSGFLFLSSCIGLGITASKAYPILNKIVGYVLSLGSLGGSIALGKFSQYALRETKRFQKEIAEEKECQKMIVK